MSDHTLYIKAFKDNDGEESIHISACDYVRVIKRGFITTVMGCNRNSESSFLGTIFSDEHQEDAYHMIIVQNSEGKIVHSFTRPKMIG